MVNVLLACDFFYPDVGGIETHLYSLAENLVRKGHIVCVLTRQRGNWTGVHNFFLKDSDQLSFKVFYLPAKPTSLGIRLPKLFLDFPRFRAICKREKIDVVHGHQLWSATAHVAVWFATVLGIVTVYTEHSLDGGGRLGSVHMRSVANVTYRLCSRIICVSQASKNNLLERISVSKEEVTVISNAVDVDLFTPKEDRMSFGNEITVAVCTRFTRLRGGKILASVIPMVCQRCQNVRFVVVGDGPFLTDLKSAVRFSNFEDRVSCLGTVEHNCLPEILKQCDFFLNMSLTDAFCISILEAAACGLRIISTKVGGIPEVLPSHYIVWLPKPSQRDIYGISTSIIDAITSPPNPSLLIEIRKYIQQRYSWNETTNRVEQVYLECQDHKRSPLQQQLRLWYRESGIGLIVLIWISFYYIVLLLFHLILNFF